MGRYVMSVHCCVFLLKYCANQMQALSKTRDGKKNHSAQSARERCELSCSRGHGLRDQSEKLASSLPPSVGTLVMATPKLTECAVTATQAEGNDENARKML